MIMVPPENLQLAVTYLVSNSGLLAIPAVAEEHLFSSCDLEPLTLTFKLQLDSVKVNQQAKHLGQNCSKIHTVH